MLKKITDDESGASKSESVNADRIEAGRHPVLVRVMRSGLQLFLMLAIVAGGVLGMNWLVANSDEPPKRPIFKTVYTVDTAVARPGDFQPDMVVYGEVQASRSVELRSLVAGEVVSVAEELRPGALIEKGAVLMRIDPFTYEVALSEADANAVETRARMAENEARIAIEKSRIQSLTEQLDLARNDLQRIRQLRQRGTATDKQVEDRALIVSQRQQALEQSQLNLVAEEARLEQQAAILERFEWRIRQAKRNLEDTALKAPFTGVISTENVEPGRMIGNNDLVVSMYDAKGLDVRFTLTDQRFGRIQSDTTGVIGRQVEVIWIVGGREYRFPATIDRIGAQITSDRGGVEVFASIQGDVTASPLRPGAFVEVIVPDQTFESHFLLPETSLYDEKTVYVVVDGKLQARKVRVAARDGEMVIVAGELAEGDEVLATRITEISEGLRVQTEEQAKAAAADKSGSGS